MSPIRAARSVPDLYQASESFERGFGGWCCHGYRGFGQINTTAQFGFVRVACQQRQSSSEQAVPPCRLLWGEQRLEPRYTSPIS